MERPTIKEFIMLLLSIGIVLCAYSCRTWYGIPVWSRDLIRVILYSVLYINWGVSLWLRLIHPQARRYAVLAAVLMEFWIIARWIRYTIMGQHPNIGRYLWYMYYLPMIFLPVFGYLVSKSIWLPEMERLPKNTMIPRVLGIVLFILVLTNDIHQFVFRFSDDGNAWTDKNSSYFVGYGIVAGFIFIMSVAFLGTLIVKGHFSRGRIWIFLICIPPFLILVYSVVYALNVSWVHVYFGDMAEVYCILFAVTFEMCIYCGLIRTNNNYEELFLFGSIGAQIVDENSQVLLANKNVARLTSEQIKGGETEPIMVEKNLLLMRKKIRYGQVLWQEDITELMEAIEEIEENNRNLEEQNRIHKKNLEAQKNIMALQEQNRVNDFIHMETKKQMEFIDYLLAQYESEIEEKSKRKYLAGAAVVGAYIKRYGNLLLVSESEKYGESQDLVRCFEESFLNLELLQVNCLCTIPSDIKLRTEDMIYIYRVFEEILEDCMFNVQDIWIKGREKNGKLHLQIEFVSDKDLSKHKSKAQDYYLEAGTNHFSFNMEKGGAKG